MNKTINYIFYITSLFLIGCISNQNKIADFEISFESNPMLKLSTFADSVKIIELRDNDSCVLGRIDKIQLYNKELFIDDYKSKMVYRFTQEGKFINKIGHRGDDPEGYVGFGGSFINNDTVYIRDTGKYKFVQYDLEGNFIKSIPILQELPIRDFVVNDSGILAFYNRGINEPNSGVYLIDKTNGSGNRLIKPEKDYLLSHFVGNHFSKINNNEYGIVDYNNGKIFHINNDSYKVAHTFSVSKEVPESTKYKYSEALDNDEYYNTYSHYMESDNYVMIIAYEELNKYVTTIYDKKTKKAISGKCKAGEGLVIDDLGNGLWFYTLPVHYDNKLFVQLLDEESDYYKIEIVYLK